MVQGARHPNTVGPLPDMIAPSAAAAKRAAFIAADHGSTASTTLSRLFRQRRRVILASRSGSAAPRSPAPCPVGSARQLRRPPDHTPPVWTAARAGSPAPGHSRPRRAARQALVTRPFATGRPDPRKNGTSMPSSTASSCSLALGQPDATARLTPEGRRASLEPPPSPAATGIRLASWMRAPPRSPAAFWSRRAARITRLPSSVGKSEIVRVQRKVSAVSSFRRSDRSPPAAPSRSRDTRRPLSQHHEGQVHLGGGAKHHLHAPLSLHTDDPDLPTTMATW